MSAAQLRTGTRVQVHRPAWHDATGRLYAAHARHQHVGRIVERTSIVVGDQRLYGVRFEDADALAWYWTRELRPAAAKAPHAGEGEG